MELPADYEEWDEAVCKAYPLNKYFIENDDITIKLYSPDSHPVFLANAPYLEEGGIFIKNKSIEAIGDSIPGLLKEKRLSYILLKSKDLFFSGCEALSHTDDSFFTFLLDISQGEEHVWEKKLKAKTRNQVRKAEKNNFQIKFGHAELLDDFYKIITRCWRDLGTPVHSYFFFKTLLEQFNDKVCIVVLYDGYIPISAAFLFILNGVLSHPFAGTVNKYKPSSANNLLYWNIIKFACEKNIKTFDMGRSRLNQGTYKFKKSWGGVAKNIYYYYFLKDNMSVPSFDTPYYKFATTAWKQMPLFLANRIGPKLIYKII